MSVTALTFPAFVDTTSSEQLWQIFNAIQGVTPPTNFAFGQQTITTTAASLPSSVLVNGVVLTNGGTAIMYIGGSSVTSSTGYALAIGASVGLAVANLSSVYIIGTASSGNISYIGS